VNNIFLAGETIDLCVPGEEDFAEWASWFNDQNITQFLEQGKYPNTIQDQREFYESAIKTGKFLTLIKSKDAELLGVFSLSDIDLDKKSCQVAYVCPKRTGSTLLAPLEALALGTEHAFLRLGMEKVLAGHAFPGLLKWVRKTEILGYKTDGVFPRDYRHGMFVSDAVRTSITKKRFLVLYEKRGNSLWPGEDRARKMIAQLKNTLSLAEKVSLAIQSMHQEHDQLIEKIERDVD
jgi:hypothetical protein